MNPSEQIKPGWLMNNEKGSFAESTILQRKPQILNRLIQENAYPGAIVRKLVDFREEIASGAILCLPETDLDAREWNDNLLSLKADRWIDLPWFFAESFFYRRLLSITQYYQAGSEFYQQDPFALQKQAQIDKDIASLRETNWLFPHMTVGDRFSGLLHAALWGNRADLSNERVALAHTRDEYHGAAHLIELIDDTEKIQRYLVTCQPEIAYFLDNVGRELFSDLALIHFLLKNDWVKKITIIAKPAPFFVSDALVEDVMHSLTCLRNSGMREVDTIVLELEKYITEKKIDLVACEMLSMPYMFSEMPRSTAEWMDQFDLLVFKGDANYRRVVEDRHWAHTTAVRPITSYFARNLLLIRTLKSELMVGLEKTVVDSLFQSTPDWLISGNYGIIQFLEENEEVLK